MGADGKGKPLRAGEESLQEYLLPKYKKGGTRIIINGSLFEYLKHHVV